LLLTAATLWLAMAVPALADTPGKLYPLEFTKGDRMLIPASINGHPVKGLLDSAAETSIVDPAFAEQIGLTGGKAVTARGSGEKTMAASLVSGVTVEAAGVTMRDQTIAVLSLEDVGQRLLGHRLDLILGRELFDNARVRVDIESKTLEILQPDVEPAGVNLKLESSHGLDTMPLTIEGHPAQAAIDLGNGSRPLLGAAFAKKLNLLEDGRAVTTDRGGGLGGETTRRVLTLKRLELAGKAYENVPVTIDENEPSHDFNVGVSLLRDYIVTLDFKAHTAWLAPRSGAPKKN